MYTGVYPEKHKHFYIWHLSQEASPFRRIAKWCGFIHGYHIKRLLYALSLRKYLFGTALYGFPFFVRHTVDYWSNFAPSIVKFWGEPDMYVGDYPTIFKVLSDTRIDYQVIWKPKGSLHKIKVRNSVKPFTYIFIGHMDPITHSYEQESLEARKTLIQIDKVIEKVYLEFEKTFKDEFLFMVFSDHGQAKIKEKVDLYAFFKSNKKNLNNYLHFIDSCYARFWFKNEEEEKEVVGVLNKMDDKGFILTDKILKHYHAQMPRKYGDLIFYLEEPYAFDVVGPKAVCAHGYLPNHNDLDGICISNRKLKRSVIVLQDIAPSILQALDLEIPEHMDGEPIW
jgi:predicted AlkP superfamily pyrophosphatase or phosphodiesterase